MTGISRRSFIASSAAAGAAALGAPAASSARAARRPNILFVLTDEQRKDTLGCYGNELAITPNFDALAASGVRFDSSYTTVPICAPCRSSLFTGYYPSTTGVTENLVPLAPEFVTWPQLLQRESYRTGYFGKWHLGTDPVPDYFDVWQGYNTGWPHWIREEPIYQLPGETAAAYEQRLAAGDRSTGAGEEQIGRYRADLETEHAIDFIRGAGDTPFACCIGYYPPHTPMHAPEEDIALHRGKFANENEDIYHAMVHRLDKNFARIMAALDEEGLRENTLIIVTSEHGHVYPRRWNNHIKRLCYDQASNVPLLMSWPGVLPEGTVIPNVINSADLVPTILELLGVAGLSGVHGQSAVNLFQGDAAGWHEDVLIQNAPYRTHGGAPEGVDVDMRERCVVTDDWKLILNTSREPELYRRHEDPLEEYNLFGQPETLEVTRDLARRLAAWGARTDDGMCGDLVRRWEAGWSVSA